MLRGKLDRKTIGIAALSGIALSQDDDGSLSGRSRLLKKVWNLRIPTGERIGSLRKLAEKPTESDLAVEAGSFLRL